MLARGYAPEAVRYLLASVPYRKQLNFTFEGLKSAETAIERLRNFKARVDGEKFQAGTNEKFLERTAQATHQFNSALDYDLNTAEALAAVFEYIREANIAMDSGEFRFENVNAARDLLERFDSIFDVLRPSAKSGAIPDEEVEALISRRVEAKKARNFVESDRIRDQLAEQGIILEDTKDGTRWKRK